MSDITHKWNSLLPFTGSYNGKFTESELSRLSKIPQQTISRHLAALVDSGILSYERQGRNKLFFLDNSKKITEVIYLILEAHKAVEFQQKQKEASIIIDELLQFTESVIVFGSYASSTPNSESDLDIIILGRYDKAKVKAIKRKYDIQINEQYLSYKEFSRALKSNKPLAIEILKNHVLFGNFSEIVKIFVKKPQ